MSEENHQSNPVLDVIVKRDSQSIRIKEKAYERRMELVEFIKVRGFYKTRLQAKGFAEHYQIAVRNIYKDFDWIKGNFTPADLREVKIDLRVGRDRALAEALKLLEDVQTIEDKARAIIVLMNVIQKYREEMEAWGDKEKVSDKIEHGVSFTFNEVVKSVEDIKDARRRDSSKPKAIGDASGTQ